jgi:dihydropyrimidinase
MVISPATLHETAGWTPYDGLAVEGWPRTVLVRGTVVVENEVFTGARSGQFQARSFAAC